MEKLLKKIRLPSKDSHKGQNGKLMIIGGSKLFHSASMWALKVASRVVDLVHYSSVPENNALVKRLNEEFRDGIIIFRGEIESYIKEDDCILIGPGMVRAEGSRIFNFQFSCLRRQAILNLENILKIEDEGVQTYYLTKYLLQKYPHKKWVIDAGALQMMELEWIPEGAILTPHRREFELLKLKAQKLKIKTKSNGLNLEEEVRMFAKEYKCTVLLKGEKDIVSSSDKFEIIVGGNAGMTKGGTGDVLAGLIAALNCNNDSFIAAAAASYINKKAGEDLFKEKGYWFNASDLADQIPKTMKKLLL